MKNFPHQMARMDSLRGALAVIQTMRAQGRDVADDGELGYDLVRARAISFLNFPDNSSDAQLEARINQEMLKPRGNQGPRTTARELRRTMHALDWIDDSNDLTLEAIDDTEAEFERVRALYLMSPDDRRESLVAGGWTTTQIDNARKILPPLAAAAGLIVEGPPGTYRLSEKGFASVADHGTQAAPTEAEMATRSALRTVDADTIAAGTGTSSSRTLTPEEQEAARQILSGRITAHNQGVKRLAALFVTGRLLEGSVDLLWESPHATGPFIEVEFKTIRQDATLQIRHALGQLFLYRYFDVERIAAGRPVEMVVATDRHVSKELGEFLDHHEISLILVTEKGWQPANVRAQRLTPYLQPPLP